MRRFIRCVLPTTATVAGLRNPDPKSTFSVSLGIGNCGVDCGDRCAAEIAVPRSPDPTRPFSDNSYTTFTSVPPACLLSTYLQGSSATRYFAG